MRHDGTVTGGRGLLEVIALSALDAERAERGGADRLEVVGTMDDDGLSPDPSLVAEIAAATGLPLRVMVRARAGFGTDGEELARLRGLAVAYRGAGADGLVLGFLDATGAVDVDAVTEIVGATDGPWTFHRAIDACPEPDRAWAVLHGLPRLDQVLTAGSTRGVGDGLTALLRRAETDEPARSRILAGGGLRPEHVPVLAQSGITAFHIGSAARPDGSFAAPVDAALVRGWRDLINDALASPG
ncbi:copper homeostasis protein CutC [Salana multivorans]|uniref:Copper homeostasis protein cutC homolog n=1 Tax=Salana multivorans TaxID=120377 RepID=A0A3N2DAY3_9MICO|nr:copper homeostasis protein CutC [Salana multivorans]